MVTQMKYLLGATAALAVLILAHVDPAFAQAAAEAAPAATPPAPPPSPINTGDTAWMLTSTALVLMMTIPGLALFYGGMVRKKNVLATIGQAFGATCIITVLWMVIGYSIAFTTNDSESLNKWIGGFKYFMLKPMTIDAVSPLAASIPEFGLYVLPNDFRHHHPGPDCRFAGGPHEVFVLHGVHGSLAHPRL